ncbi:substrate-binding domain-containing protein [Asticcacaulis benevestitus]|uniref:HTH lacI-type domain-containing protein n=1 Tax=Asticcacaulis benevestitus DSM 16100 = ATCC BAA-896 TaxID=1121022 RepID=V4PEG1_9CAUL|nr:substrate-binding domain-containing protein [Asticcacaulis benevestitus]ESQ86491.1 hypothetical protein ABENE_18380 [Asticcacaulis benevestitus DSM 16100 = ATCC BAA-896]
MEGTPDKTITLQDVAARAGVSTSTASRALAGNPVISEAVRQSVMEAARGMQYSIPLRKPRSKHVVDLVTVVMPPVGARVFPDPFILELLGGIALAMRERGRDLALAHVVPNNDDTLNALLKSNSNGAFIVLGQSQYHSALNRQFRQGRAFVVWGPEIDGQLYCSVGGDNFAGAVKLTRHLLRSGRKRIVFLGLAPFEAITERCRGYRWALEEAGLPIDPRLIRSADIGYDDAFDPVNDLLDGSVPFDAIVASTDMIALGAIAALRRRGIDVPADVAVVGYDDVALARHATPALTTVRQDVVRAGQLLVSKLFRREAGLSAASERLPTEMVVRDSCGG